jgi:hypothetical protein
MTRFIVRLGMPAAVALALATIAVAASAFAPPARAAGSAEPPYPHGKYVEECSLCHGAEGWRPARVSSKFDHAKFFRLEGAHKTASCSACHQSLKFAEDNTKVDCVACHMDVHDGELGADCARCHTARSFIDYMRMKRAHNLTRFPLVGAHFAADCDSCHPLQPQGHLRYVNTQTDCVACHLDDYLATTNPDHQAGLFPQDCTQCHFQIAWMPARFPAHDPLFFPIYSGTHRGKWTSCSDCHYQTGVYTTFSCILCHAHNDATKTANQHAGVAGYSYTSAACFSCHPDGKKP